MNLSALRPTPIKLVCARLPLLVWIVAWLSAGSAIEALALPICDGADYLARDPDAGEAAAYAFGPRPSGTCVAGFVHFADADVVVTSLSEGEGHADLVNLSAFVLAKEADGYRLVKSFRNFGRSGGGWGRTGKIVGTRMGGNDAFVVEDGSETQGILSDSVEFYVFRDGSLVSLGSVLVGWDDKGAQEDESKSTVINGVFSVDPGDEHVNVRYTARSGATSKIWQATWGSNNGRFSLLSGEPPPQIALDSP